MSHNGSENHQILYSAQNLVALFSALLIDAREIPSESIDPALFADPAFVKVYNNTMDLRSLTSALGRGDLRQMVSGRGYVLSGLKALQSNLRHLSWQTERIAQGDFSQKVDFLGDFSTSFNTMVEQLAKMTDQMQRLASIDALTQIHNRLSLEQFIDAAFANARKEPAPLSVLVFDIDFFKRVNDQYGHVVGDHLLVKISETLSQQFRATDMFARYGGEEFVAVLPNTAVNVAEQIAQRSLQAVADQRLPVEDGDELRVTVSIGVSQLRDSDETYIDLLERGDQALYQAKHNGRNQVCTA